MADRTRRRPALPRFAEAEHRYGFVLVLILASLVFGLASPDKEWARVVTIGLQGATLLATLSASRIHRFLFRLASVLVAAAILSSMGILIGSGELGATAARLVTLLLVLLAPVAIARGVVLDLRERGEVSLHTMFGVLCIYLLIGSLFAFLYGLADSVSSTPFFASHVSATVSDFLYFSFATMTTVGYGDLTAGSDLARSLAIAEALIGQIYLVTVVAVIIGNLSRRRS